MTNCACFFSVSLLGLTLVGCGGAAAQNQPAPAEPAVETVPTPTTEASNVEDLEEAGPAESDSQQSAETEETPAETSEDSASSAPSSTAKKSPREMLTEAGLGFMIDLTASSKKPGKAFKGDVMAFKREGPERYRWVIYDRKGEQLKEVFSVPIEFEEKGETSIVIKPKGAGKGARPILGGQQSITISIPNDYSIEIEDPKLGHLVYNAKFSLIEGE